MNGVDLNLLRVFEALMRERSVSAAAVRLGVRQPAASQSLARLRVLFGDELFRRQGRVMTPTARALALEEPINRALSAAREALEPAAPFDPATSRRVFTISGGDYALSAVVPGLVARVRAAAPNLDLRFRFIEKPQIERLLDDGVLDLALGVFPDPPKRFDDRAVLEERFVCVARRDHPAFEAGFGPRDYALAPHLLVTERGDDTGVVDEALARTGLSRRIVVTVPSVLVVRRLLRQTDLIATIGARAASGFSGDPALKIVAPPIFLPPWRLQMINRRRTQPDAGLQWIIRQILDVGRQPARQPSDPPQAQDFRA